MGIKLNNKLALVLLLGLLVIVYVPFSTVAASADKNVSQGGYIVKFLNSSESHSPATVYNTITQGQTNWQSTIINSYMTTLDVNLDWGNPSNSLQLTIYSPDGNVFGPYYDGDDGIINGQINLQIQNPNGIAQGTWYYKVYGYSVTGTQSYSI